MTKDTSFRANKLAEEAGFRTFRYTTNSNSEADSPLTLEKLQEAFSKLGAPSPAPQVRVSHSATMEPNAEPHTDDMRAMVDTIGKVRVPACIRIKSMFGEMIVVHPDMLVKNKK